MNRILITLLALGIALTFFACKNDTQTAAAGSAKVNGTVLDVSTNGPVADVSVTVTPNPSEGSATQATKSDGSFSFTFATDSSQSVTLRFQKTGYRDTTLIVQISSGNVTTVNLSMSTRLPISGGAGTGIAATIALISVNPTDVAVYGVGGMETAIIQWEVRDSLGLPINSSHAVTLNFLVANGPGGLEYIHPATATTDAQGRAATTFNSGVRSGVVQVIASTVVAGRTIASTPVRLVIHSGLPDSAHFTIAPEKHNFPTLGIAGNRLGISVLVGDKYSNPVAQNTAVYFNTRAGVTQASVFTNGDGQGTAFLISGNPAPFGIYSAPVYGDGYHYVIAQTVGENARTVKDSTIILWSGRSMVSNISPGSVNIPANGSQTFTFQVSDYLGHPLASGTTISVSASATPWPVNVFFGIGGSITLDDVILPGQGATNFSFTVADAADTIAVSNVYVSVSVAGPNGFANGSVSGISH